MSIDMYNLKEKCRKVGRILCTVRNTNIHQLLSLLDTVEKFKPLKWKIKISDEKENSFKMAFSS